MFFKIVAIVSISPEQPLPMLGDVYPFEGWDLLVFAQLEIPTDFSGPRSPEPVEFNWVRLFDIGFLERPLDPCFGLRRA